MQTNESERSEEDDMPCEEVDVNLSEEGEGDKKAATSSKGKARQGEKAVSEVRNGDPENTSLCFE
jgi:hypothetical protein